MAEISWFGAIGTNSYYNGPNWVGSNAPGAADSARFGNAADRVIAIPDLGVANGGVGQVNRWVFETPQDYRFTLLTNARFQFLGQGILLLGDGPVIIDMQSASQLNFRNLSGSGGARIEVASLANLFFLDEATALESLITNRGVVVFRDDAIAVRAVFENLDAGFIQFEDRSAAGDAVFENDTLATLRFVGSSSADEATILNGGDVSFLGFSSASLSVVDNRPGGEVQFSENSTAGSATIENFGRLVFSENATAGASTIITRSGASVEFRDFTYAGNARFLTAADGHVDFTDSTGPNGSFRLTAGSIAGGGTYGLGENRLVVGSGGLSGTVTGSVQDGGIFGGVGASLVKVGTGTLRLAGDNTYTGGSFANGGILRIDGLVLNDATVNAGGTLAGSGAVTGSVAVRNGGTLLPGGAGGPLNTGGVQLGNGASLAIEIGGPVPGAGHSQLAVNGLVVLSGGRLEATLTGGFNPGNNVSQIFVIVDNDRADRVQGSFAGLSEGATTLIDGRFFAVSYRGGDGNDVTLSSLGARITGTASGDRIDGRNSPEGQPVATAFADEIFGRGGNDRIFGLGGNDTLYGAAGNDTLQGGPGNDRLFGGDGLDHLIGGLGNDTLDGGRGNDLLLGGPGQDLLRGGPGNDRLEGGLGNDRLFGGDGQDRLFGGAGNDTLDGGRGNDVLVGGTGRDLLRGGAGNDTLIGGPSNDTLFGGPGRDRLDGGPGNDILIGGPGADTFVFRVGSGRDRVQDFENDLDKVQLANGLGFDDLVLSSVAGGVRIEIAGNGADQLVLLGVSLSQIDSGDFI